MSARKPPNAARSTRPLSSYRAKRDFTLSPEPPGTAAKRRVAGYSYCIQKHLASHLHYDFRLEHAGVLLSWAVPKGPSLDPKIKRLAMQVEDHPVAYGDFEGVIPSGYGAGIVVLWDRGDWEPLDADVDAALRTGHLAFLVHGRKLSGRWDLIRATRMGSNAWLLVKHADAAATTRDITRSKPDSVLGNGDFSEILARQARPPWSDKPPVQGGETGALYREIIAKAERLRHRRKEPVAH